MDKFQQASGSYPTNGFVPTNPNQGGPIPPPQFPYMFYGQQQPQMGTVLPSQPLHPMMPRSNMMMMGGPMPPYGMPPLQSIPGFPMTHPQSSPDMIRPPISMMPQMMRPPMIPGGPIPPLQHLPVMPAMPAMLSHPSLEFRPKQLPPKPLPMPSSNLVPKLPGSVVSATNGSVTVMGGPTGALAHLSASVTSSAFQDLLTTVYVGHIGPSISDEKIQKLLQTCGEIRSWKQGVSETGKKLDFGFCVYESALSTIKAILYLGGGNIKSITELHDKPVHPIQADLDTEISNVTAETTTPFVVRFGMDTPLIVTADEITKAHLRTIKTGEQDIEDDPSHAEQMRKTIQDCLQDIFMSETHDFLDRLDEDVQTSHASKRSRVSSQPKQDPSESNLDEIDMEALEKASIEADQIEQRRAERREQDRMATLQERQRRWENSEAGRLRRIEADESTDAANETRRIHAREFISKRLAEYDDDIEREKGSDEFYRDRSRWIDRRSRDRQREAELDDRDRAMEESERAFANEHERESAARVEANTASGVIVSRIMTKDERIEAIQALVANIPAERDGLWAWPIKWKFLDETIVDVKLRPFLKRKIVEYVGDEETDLTEFILEKIKKQDSAQSVLEELEAVLDDETEVFVMKLWRMVIYETEARAQGL
ncbi:hypothetical protein BATDEDRAFT_91920 [Batrachochytrium dendrobatidis JAM81]|uniref:PWI domain-containing protein n=1 Tax=Batrachochytrium dendrobatidis (strain JAM81 / FGSC 10211) TaxID=684364 RepID=F4PCI5_BATDJ|nr:uncharacterized protein BATDEDRAFT_91920 [Batrachochytrium dendrobatidis JAM81]EGF77204.1 hypothetical protein BATDEDRAFT_91920 [Batrachochytrium dendrobatidis JAM81]|eukprot:XP_006682312.1 hypothetical protein BATDEDRAFT_91920 [Batrachochytrium dendrobatidis JAM81]